MRKLTASQKKLLLSAMKADPSIRGYDSLPEDIEDRLIAMNSTEILWNEADRFIRDTRMKALLSSPFPY